MLLPPCRAMLLILRRCRVVMLLLARVMSVTRYAATLLRQMPRRYSLFTRTCRERRDIYARYVDMLMPRYGALMRDGALRYDATPPVTRRRCYFITVIEFSFSPYADAYCCYHAITLRHTIAAIISLSMPPYTPADCRSCRFVAAATPPMPMPLRQCLMFHAALRYAAGFDMLRRDTLLFSLPCPLTLR